MSSSWFILGEVLRRIDGRPYDRLIREELFEPLGMADSWVGMSPEQFAAYGGEESERIAVMYETSGPEPRPHRWHQEDHVVNPSPGGNGRGPIRELGRFYEALLAGGVAASGERLLTPQTVEALTARHRVGLYDHTFRHVMDWGLGFIVNSAIYDQPTLPYAYGPHASRRTYGHSGYKSSTAFADPENRLVVALATNGTPGDEDHLDRMESLCAAVYEDLGIVGGGAGDREEREERERARRAGRERSLSRSLRRGGRRARAARRGSGTARELEGWRGKLAPRHGPRRTGIDARTISRTRSMTPSTAAARPAPRVDVRCRREAGSLESKRAEGTPLLRRPRSPSG